jgi:UDP-glucuronate decarboxylase
MATCVVTGGAGFLGSHLCEYLLERGNRVICIDNLDTGSLRNIAHIRGEDFEFVHQDLTETVQIEGEVDFVYHLASPASPIDYARLPLHTLKVGSYGTHHMLGVAKFKRARFLLASTSEVYGDPQIHPQPESYWGHVNPIGPRGVYDEAKRYAEALTMAYHRQQGVDTAIVRIFNSVLADEQIVYDDGRELRRETAGELSARLATFALATAATPALATHVGTWGAVGSGPTPAMEFPLREFTVPAFDDEKRIRAAPAASFVGHPTSQRCYEVSTRYGRSIRVTGDHSLFVEGEDGEPIAKPVSELSGNDRVAIGRRLAVPERDREEIHMIEAWRWDERDPWELRAEDEGLGALVWEHRREVWELLVSQRRGNGPNWRNTAWTQIITMRETDRVPMPVLWWIRTAAPRSGRVRAYRGQSSLPATVRITDELLWFLGVWTAEGTWFDEGKSGFLSISCDQQVVDRAARFIEGELGLHAVRIPCKAGRPPAVTVNSRLLLLLMKFLGFERGRRRIPGWILGLPLSRLKWFIEGYREGDGVHSGKKFDEGKLHAFVTVDDELKDDLILALARFGLLPSVGRYETQLTAKTGDRKYPFWRLTLCKVSPWSPLEWDQGVEQKLNARTNGDLVWAAIKEIREVDATPLVFDFSVPGLENFWAGTGVLAHNTFGARMRPHDGRAIPTFLRQALQDKPLTVFGDGGQTRSFCYVDDLIRGLVLLMESDVHMPVNIGNPTEHSLLELAEAVIEVTESRSEIVYEALPVDDPQVRQPDITRARELLGWEPKVGLHEGLRKTIEAAGVEQLVGAAD